MRRSIRYISLLMAFALLISAVMSISVSAANTDEDSEPKLYPGLINDQVVIYDCDTNVSDPVKVPATVEGYTVTGIYEHAFAFCSQMPSVELPESIRRIERYAFDHCEALSEIDLPEGIEYVGQYAFSNCSSLESITIPSTLGEIDKSAFQSCKSLKEVHVKDLSAWCEIEFADSISNPIYLARAIYIDGEQVTALVIPDGVKKISKYAFARCEALESVTIPDSVTYVSINAFDDCDKDMKIICNKDSAAHIYAKENNFKYELLDAEETEAAEAGGCSSSFGSALALPIVLSLAGAVIFRKKKDMI